MVPLFLKIAYRYLWKNKLFSGLNILGLALGMAAFLVITLYVSYERSYDNFEGADQVYRVYLDYKKGGIYQPGDAQTYNLTGPTLKRELPEVTEHLRLYEFDRVTFVRGENVLEQPAGVLAEPSFFELFGRHLLRGEGERLSQPNTIVLGERLAERLFGKEDPLGQHLRVFYGPETQVEVVGIMEDSPQNTHFKVPFLIGFDTFKTWAAFEGQQDLNWNQNNYFTYIKVDPRADIDLLRDKITGSDYQKHEDERHNIEPLRDIHLYSDKPYEAEANGSISRVRFLSAIAMIILLLSWMNYLNLTTTKSIERAREVGIRKVSGARRPQLVMQSLLESLLINLVALVLAIVLVVLLLPVFNEFTGTSLGLELLNASYILPFLLFILVGTLLSALYPALIISRFSPARALKGKLPAGRRGFGLRQGLITLQFLGTVVLIIGTLVVMRQNSYLQDQPIGTELGHRIALRGAMLEAQADSVMLLRSEVLEAELERLPFVEAATRCTTYPGDGYDNLSSTVGMLFPNGTQSERLLFYIYAAEPDYYDLMDMEFAAGGPYPDTREPLDPHIIINETLAREMGYVNMEDAIGGQPEFWGRPWTISGVIRDYHHFGLKEAIRPMVIGQRSTFDNVVVRLNPQAVSLASLPGMLDQLEETWTSVFPQSTVNLTFLDQQFEAQYREDRKFETAFAIFTGLGIFIAALGLFGLTAYTCLQRQKEIGIRKVSGASVVQILALLNKDFLRWVALAFGLGAPIGWYIMNRWLQEFAYRTSLSWWVFLVAGMVALVIALLSVSFQALKAATQNPVNSLRTE